MTAAPRDRGGDAVEATSRTLLGGAGTSWTMTIASRPIGLRLGFALLLLLAVAVLDEATGKEVSFSIFYLAPVAFAGGFVSRRAGIVFALLGAAWWGSLEFLAGPRYSAAWIPFWNTGVRLGFFLLVNELIDAVRLAHLRERALSRSDPVTGIANTRMFEEHVDRVLAESRRHGRPFTIAYFDLDRFKRVNDELGHFEGDRVLKAVAAIAAVRLRTTDVFARLGGDEFGVLMPETGAEQARVCLERVAQSLVASLEARWNVGATFGAVTFVKPPDDAGEAVRRADELMYRGKSEGRGRIVQGTWPDALAAAASDLRRV